MQINRAYNSQTNGGFLDFHWSGRGDGPTNQLLLYLFPLHLTGTPDGYEFTVQAGYYPAKGIAAVVPAWEESRSHPVVPLLRGALQGGPVEPLLDYLIELAIEPLSGILEECLAMERRGEPLQDMDVVQEDRTASQAGAGAVRA